MDANGNPPAEHRRLGLALSGGGFRAALFHIGVLARLAELDLLREVQVLSTVSGGSIIGALYYLHVRRLLESRPDDEITSRDYVDIVLDIVRDFPRAIACNLRMRAFANVRKNWRMFHDRRYSRSDRMAELYEEYLYAPLAPAGESGRIELPALRIQPKGVGGAFHPFKSADGAGGPSPNDGRRNKVPALVINATTLNTGHLFQFTAAWMGEPPRDREEGGSADGNILLRRAPYERLPEKYQTLPLGVAVAASATVPGIFPPLALTDLFEDAGVALTPQLVDGGVNDNQGIAALFDPEHACTDIIISDASGQMDDLVDPSTYPLGVMQRSNSILMDRVREEQITIARLRRRRAGAVALLHLKQGLPQRDMNPIGAPCAESGAGERGPLNQRTLYGVHPRMQERLAGVRTDLDTFTETECYALMADGYLIATDQMQTMATAWQRSPQRRPEGWSFLAVAPLLAIPDRDRSFSAQIALASRRFGKTLHMVPWLRWTVHPWTARVLAALVLFGAGWLVERFGMAVFTALGGAVVLGLLLAALNGVRAWADTRQHRALARSIRWLLALGPGLLSAPLLAFMAGRHLAVFNPLRCEEGEVGRCNGLSVLAESTAPQQ